MKKSTAIFVSVCFMLSESALYVASASVSRDVIPAETGPQQRESPIKDFRDDGSLAIPPEYGTIEAFHQGTNGKTILYIQDAHDSLEAQENIAKIIHYLVEHYGVWTIFEEGYEGPVPTDEFFGFIKDPEIKEKVSYFLMDKLRLGGAEYAHINREREFRLIGADSLELHKKNVETARRHSENQETIQKNLTALKVEIEKLAQIHFPPPFGKWMRLKERYDNRQLQLMDYLQRTATLFPTEQDEALAPYPNLRLLLEAYGSTNQQTQEKINAIDPRYLFEEIERLEEDLAGSFLGGERDRRIFYYFRLLNILKRLNKLEITPDEYEVIQKEIRFLNTQEMVDFIARHSKKTIVLSRRWESAIQSAIQVYETAHARDETIAKALLCNDHQDIAVLVFGGFHRGPIEKMLKRLGFSYFVVTPKMADFDGRHQAYYKQLTSTGYHPFEIPLVTTHGFRPESVLNLGRSETRTYLQVLANAIERGWERLGLGRFHCL